MLITILLWAFWCLLHSLLIHPTVQNKLYTWSSKLSPGTYRLCYILFSLITLAPVVGYTLAQEQTVLFAFSGAWRILQILLLCYAALMFSLGSQAYDMPFFLGLRQWKDFRDGRAQRAIEFHHSGILRYVRHPWYSGRDCISMGNKYADNGIPAGKDAPYRLFHNWDHTGREAIKKGIGTALYCILQASTHAAALEAVQNFLT
ncbi:NnrU family protein [Desulfogranum marinum]|uniref:NnrU family protein n=1 Tax=Desulfogranum marinum TaxID=453220 RepID=UPI001964D131|nr:NnrU family protein [Desulfogranum marinum]MBM9514215.1 hypothetical protein [Desulfogranum marinum]